jgi:hypothetical protein
MDPLPVTLGTSGSLGVSAGTGAISEAAGSRLLTSSAERDCAVTKAENMIHTIITNLILFIAHLPKVSHMPCI